MAQELGPKQKQWIEALRSGKYKQGGHVLHNEKNEFCCLGVACNLFYEGKPLRNGCYVYGDQHIVAPLSVVEQLALYSDLGNLKATSEEDKGYVSLAAMNDYGMSFEEIADFIEENPSLVFTHPA